MLKAGHSNKKNDLLFLIRIHIISLGHYNIFLKDDIPEVQAK